MGESEEAKQGTPPQGTPAGQSSVGQSVTTSPETYTKEQVQKLVSDALTEQGRKHKTEVGAILKERNTLKLEIQTKDDELQGITSERETLRSQIDDLSSGDPEKFNLVKKDRELRERERQLRADKQALETDKLAIQERVKTADDILRERTIQVIVGEYQGGDAARLRDLCDTLQASSEEQIRKVADTIWPKQSLAKSTSSPLKPDSNVSVGSGTLTVEQVKKMSPEERAARSKEIAKLPLSLGLS